MDEIKLMSFIENIMETNKDDELNMKKELSELARKLRNDNAPSNLVSFAEDVAKYSKGLSNYIRCDKCSYNKEDFSDVIRAIRSNEFYEWIHSRYSGHDLKNAYNGCFA